MTEIGGVGYVEEFRTRMNEVHSRIFNLSSHECYKKTNGIWSGRQSEMVSIKKFIDPILFLMHFKYTGVGKNAPTSNTYSVTSENIIIHDAIHLAEQWRILKNLAFGKIKFPDIKIQFSESKTIPIILFPTLLAQHTLLAENVIFYIHRGFTNFANPQWTGDIEVDLLSNSDLDTFIKNYLFACLGLTEKLLNNEVCIDDNLYSSVLNDIQSQITEETARERIPDELCHEFKQWYATYLNDIQKNHIDFIVNIAEAQVIPSELSKLYSLENAYLEEKVRDLKLLFCEG
jgi:hypothetical protein